MRFLFPSVFLLATASLPLNAQSESKSLLWNSLTPEQHAVLNSGKPLSLEEEIPGNPWPRFTVYQLVKASPAQVAAVFWDCEKDPEYIPNCLRVSVLSRPSPNIVEAEYTLKTPFFLPDEVYVSRNELKRGPDGSYGVTWRVLRSRFTKSCSGNLQLEQHDGGTLIRYSNLVEPASRIAKLLRASASRQVVESVQSLVDHVGDLLVRPGTTLEKQVRSLDEALAPRAGSRPASK